MSWMLFLMVYNWPVFRCPSLAGFGCPPRIVAPADEDEDDGETDDEEDDARD